MENNNVNLKNKHLTLDDRYVIQNSLKDRLSFKAIAAKVNKDCTTISKEVKNHLTFEQIGAPYRPFNDCALRKDCSHYEDICPFCISKRSKKCSKCGKCHYICCEYKKETCPKLDKPPYVCNGCPDLNKCTLEKHKYKALVANNEYEEYKSESRSGFNLTEDEISELDSLISPLIKNGQSLHHIMVNNTDQIMCSERSAYNYIKNNLFTAKSYNMPRTVRFRARKKKSVDLKIDKKCRIDRKYEDYLKYCKEHPELHTVQLDTVEGKKGRPVLLTVHFVLPKLQLAFYREHNNSQSVIDIFKDLYNKLGHDTYTKLFPILLADNGTEFSNPKALEFNKKGQRISRVFYCDPSAPNQKGACEVNHEFIRRIIPKGVDIGLYTQDDIFLMMNHINSYGRPELQDKTPYEMFEFYFDKDGSILNTLNVNKIEPNNIILKESLLKK